MNSDIYTSFFLFVILLDFSQAKPIVITDFPMNRVPLGLKKNKKKEVAVLSWHQLEYCNEKVSF